jgi:outer membrane protein insertion porin family
MRAIPLFVLLLASLLTAPLAMQAQAPLAPAAVAGTAVAPVAEPIVAAIDIEFSDVRNVSDEAVLARVQLRPGMPYSQTLVDRSIRSLYNTRWFDYIETRSETLADGRVRLVFKVQARYRLERIEFSGVDTSTSRRLRRESESRVGGPLDERQIRKDADKMLTYYRERGFTDARVDYDIQRNRETGMGTVTFLVNEGVRLKIATINFVGNTSVTSRQLRKTMETRRRWWMSWLTGSGRFDETKFQEDLDKLRELYQNKGYLDVSIPESNVSLDYPKPGQIVITIRIDEGRQYRVGNVTFEGNTIFTSFQLYPQLSLLPGDVFAPETLDEDVERLTNIYGAVGYLDTVVRPERRANIQTGNIDLVYTIRESERFDVESIIIEGNTKTKSTVIIRELAMSPGRTFNLIYMKNSEARLRNSRFFDEVQLSPTPTNIPGKRDLKIRVKEGRTGNFQFGAGFSSLENVVLFFEISQSNFDLFSWRSPFLQGAGQKFRFRGSIGSQSNELVLAFEEPWLFERRLSFGFELFRRETDYDSTTYNELRTGIEIYLRKRLFGLVDGQLAYTFEIVDLQDVTFNAPTLIRAEAENSPRSISKVDFTVVRDTRNDLIFTTRGSRVSFITTFAGVGGDTEYIRLETRNAFFIPTFETGDQVISVLFRAGTLWEYSSQPVPFFDRYFLGGPNSLRGFEYREVGPFQQGEPIGGKSYAFASLEYSIKVADPLRLALFYDWGFVNSDQFDFSPAGYNDNWGLASACWCSATRCASTSVCR